MCSRILMSSRMYEAKSFVPVYQLDFQSWMTPTRRPPGWIFWPTSAHLRCRSYAGTAKTKPRKDAGSARSWKLRARLRTPRGAGLQPPSACEMRRRGVPSNSRLLRLVLCAAPRLRLLLGRRDLRRRLGLLRLAPGGLGPWLELRQDDRDVARRLADPADTA